LKKKKKKQTHHITHSPHTPNPKVSPREKKKSYTIYNIVFTGVFYTRSENISLCMRKCSGCTPFKLPKYWRDVKRNQKFRPTAKSFKTSDTFSLCHIL